MQKVPNPKLDLFVLRGFLDSETCLALIERIDERRRPSEIADDIGVAGFRTSETCDLDSSDPLVAEVDRKLTGLLGIPASYGEPIQGQRYAPGQEFKPHLDWFAPGSAAWQREKAFGGQRAVTAMVYLNTVGEGGETDFPELDIAISPGAGTLIVWNNADESGQLNPRTIHAGNPVIRGTKYIVTRWYRTQPWR